MKGRRARRQRREGPRRSVGEGYRRRNSSGDGGQEEEMVEVDEEWNQVILCKTFLKCLALARVVQQQCQ